MKKWDGELIGTVITILIGLSFIAVSVSIPLPSEYGTFYGIPHALNPQYGELAGEKTFLFVLGFTFLLAGVGALLFSYHKKYVAQLEISREKEYWQKREQEKKYLN